MIWTSITAVVIGYLLSCTPSAYITAQWLRGVDIRELGDRNMVLASASVFVPLPIVAWWFGASGVPIAYSIALPCLVWFTYYITTRRLPVGAKP